MLVTCKTVDRRFFEDIQKIGYKNKNQKSRICVKHRTYVGKTKENELSKSKIRVKINKYYLVAIATYVVVTLLSLSVGWYVMGYKPESLSSYRELRNRFYTVRFKLHFAPGYSSSRLTFCSHHLIIQRDPDICSAPVYISLIFRQTTCYAILAFCI